jgi:hypothetical protein
MSDVPLMIHKLVREWGTAKHANHKGVRTYSALSCQFCLRSDAERSAYVDDPNLPNDVNEFWRIAEWAELFKDTEFGQWGLRIHTQSEAASEKEIEINLAAKALKPSDLVLGRFFGDSELLLVRCDREENDFGYVIVVPPVYERNDWPLVAHTFCEFVDRYTRSEGQKYWEQ